MAKQMHVSLNYATHLPCLMIAMAKTTGDVLELGMGVFSTPYLHYECMLTNRHLFSYENYEPWLKFFLKYGYENPVHKITHVEKYSDAPIDRPWDVVLIDQTPDISRTEEIRRLANLGKYIICHDSNPSNDKVTHYSEIYHLFKYQTDWALEQNRTTILSNIVDLKGFWDKDDYIRPHTK